MNELFELLNRGPLGNAAAKQFDVSISFVVKLMQRWKQRGTIKADKYGGWKKSKLAPHGDRIRALVMENCDITIDELCVLLAAEGIEAKRSTLGDFLLAQGLSRKKRQPTPPSRSALTSRRREPLGATSNRDCRTAANGFAVAAQLPPWPPAARSTAQASLPGSSKPWSRPCPRAARIGTRWLYLPSRNGRLSRCTTRPSRPRRSSASGGRAT